MNSNSEKIPAHTQRPRLRVVLPLLLVCFGVTMVLVREALKPAAPAPRAQGKKTALRDELLIEQSPAEVARPIRPSRRSPSAVNSVPDTSLSQPEIAVESADGSARSAGRSSAIRSAGIRGPRALSTITSSNGFAQVSGRIQLKGTPPPEREIPLDPSCGSLHTNQITTHLYVVGAEGGLADVLIYSQSIGAALTPPPTEPVILDQIGCEYFPYVFAVRVGQPFLVRNSDPLLHNVHITPAQTENQEWNLAQRAGAKDLKFTFNNPEFFMRIKCDVHNWMFAYVNVMPHSFFAVSDQDGLFTIPNLPPGRHRIAAFHRKEGQHLKEIDVSPDQHLELNFTFEIPERALRPQISETSPLR